MHRPPHPTTPQPLLWTTLVLLVVLVLALGVLYLLRQSAPEVRPTATVAVSGHGLEPLPQRPGQQSITLHFLSREEPLLVREVRWVPADESLENLISLTVALLVAGSTDETLISPLPAGTRLLSCFYEEQKRRAVLDLSSHCVEGQAGDTFSEWATLYGLVNSVASLSPGIEEVLLLSEGEPVEESPGNWDWSFPFAPDATFVRYRASDSSQP